MTSPRRSYWLSFFALPILVVLGLYWPTLSQPFFWDDAANFPFVMSRSFLQLWINVEDMGYYRPISFTLYKVFFGLEPPGAILFAHLLLLAVHTANAWLTGLLARCLLCRARPQPKSAGAATPDCEGVALMAALLFACYPYAALPVAHFASLTHLSVTFFMLGTTVAALCYLHGSQIGWLVVAIGLAGLAPFVHETGVMAGPIALLVVVLKDWSSAWQHRRSLWALPFASAIFVVVWLMVPKSPNTFGPIGLGGMLASLTFFTQGPTFPFQPLSRILIDWLPRLKPSSLVSFAGLPWWLIATMWGVALAATATAGLTLPSDRRWRVLGVALGWTLLAALPSVLVLPVPYITVSQRLLYAVAPGAVVLWAAACASLAGHVRGPGLRGVIALGLVAGIVMVPVLYIRREMGLHELALRPLQALVTVARRYPAQRHLVINAVNWVNFRQPWYALGQEGVSVTAPYIDFTTLVHMNSRSPAQFSAASFPEILPELKIHSFSTIAEDNPWSWGDVATWSPEWDRVWLTNYRDEAITVEEVGSVQRGTARPPDEYGASFGNALFLTKAELQIAGSTAIATLDWKVLDGIPGATVFRHVYDCQGHMVAQGDGFALGRTLRFESLAPGTEVHDIRNITLDEPPASDCLTLGVGLYLPDGTRVPALQVDGEMLQNGEVLVHADLNTRQ